MGGTMKRLIVFATILGLSSGQALAQYKCTINGKTVYADVPCAHNAKPVGALEDRVSRDAEVERLRQSLSERRQRDRIEGREDAMLQSQQRAMQQAIAAEADQARADQAARQRRCAYLQNDVTRNRQGVARYQDFGWQRQLTEQENQLRRNQDAFDRECR